MMNKAPMAKIQELTSEIAELRREVAQLHRKIDVVLLQVRQRGGSPQRLGSASPWMHAKEAAEYAGVHPATLTKLARLGKINHGSDGRTYRFTADQIDAYLLVNGRGGK